MPLPQDSEAPGPREGWIVTHLGTQLATEGALGVGREQKMRKGVDTERKRRSGPVSRRGGRAHTRGTVTSARLGPGVGVHHVLVDDTDM